MTNGRIWPVLLENLLQLLYNAANSIVVGQHIGLSALAAVNETT